MRERRFVRFRVDMYEDTKLKIIDKMEERDLVHYFWNRIVILTGKVNREGELFLSKNIPYTIETLAIEFNREIVQVKSALKILMSLEMIELVEDKIYKVANFEKHQNIKVNEKSKNRDNVNEVKSYKDENKEIKENLIVTDSKEKASKIDNKIIEYKNAENKKHEIFKENNYYDDKNNTIYGKTNDNNESKILPIISESVTPNNISSCNEESPGINSIAKINTEKVKDQELIEFKNNNINNENINRNIVPMKNINNTANADIINSNENFNGEIKNIIYEDNLQNENWVAQKKKRRTNVKKGKAKNTSVISDFDVDDDDNEIIEFHKGELKIGKGETVISSFDMG